MINEIEIKNFKSISNLNYKCKYLNLITGTNSSGKSTFLQALLLIKQNSSSNIGLNGEIVSVGDFRDVKNFNISSKKISIEANCDQKPYYLIFDEDGVEKNNLNQDAGIQCKITYLSCNRIGAEDTYKKNYSSNKSVGINGEYTIFCLDKYSDQKLEESLVKNTEDLTLISQVNYWLSYILDATVSTEDITGTDYVKCFYNVNNTRAVRPKNVGAGLSYLISVLVMCLLSENNDVLIIENPEIHLHPKAQSKVCDFLYFISCANRQIFIETHSDHIFNGIRAGIANSTMSSEKISVNFFNVKDNCTKNTVITFGKRGKIENYVEGLFDQFNIDLDRMLGI